MTAAKTKTGGHHASAANVICNCQPLLNYRRREEREKMMNKNVSNAFKIYKESLSLSSAAMAVIETIRSEDEKTNYRDLCFSLMFICIEKCPTLYTQMLEKEEKKDAPQKSAEAVVNSI